MSLKDEYQELKKKREMDITDRIDSFVNDPARGAFVSRYGNQLYEDLIPSFLKADRNKAVAILLERNSRKEQDPEKQEILKILSKVIRKKLSVEDLAKTLALTSVELLLLGAIVADTPTKRNVLKNKAKSLLGLSVSVSEQRDTQHVSQDIFKLNERLVLEIPNRFKDLELAKTLTDFVNDILSKPEKEQHELFTILFDKILSVINDPNKEVSEEDFNCLHYFQMLVTGKLENLEDVKVTKI